ncbi:MAG: single-stranded-DNA-specific exonuclease RecJ [Eubacteriales bacterium]|nr:single-stranded-DNA-specific exonuclease RecJ [Eubacteriales bacterium]
MKRIWIFPEEEKSNQRKIIEYLLEKRGIYGKEEMDDFLSDSPQLAFDPFLMKDMESGVRRILNAISAGQRICIYGDYDADGVCAISLLLEILGKLSAKVSYYIPSRFDEGYGLNREAIQAIKNKGVDLVITVDCGSVSFDEVEYAKEIGLDIIVTDHHNVNDKAASCLLINPKQEGCPYPERELSGCGVAFKLAQALQRSTNLTKSDLNRVLDLVAIATVGDMVPLLGENRTMVKYGVKMINKGLRPGLTKLIEGIGLRIGEIKAENLAYVIVPHLNAGGRIMTAETGVTLLTSRDEWELTQAANQLIANNKKRRKIQEEAFEEVLFIVEEHHQNDLILVIDALNVHEGIAGIVAGKLKEKYHRPAILVTPSGDDSLKGTGRSLDGINLYEILSPCRGFFEKFGGHAGACGFLMKKDKLETLRKALHTIGENLYRADSSLFVPKLNIDGILAPQWVNDKLIQKLEKLEPYGHKNPKPLFCLQDLSLKNPVFMGEQQQHVRFLASDIACILFNRGAEYKEQLRSGIKGDLVGYPEINRWNGIEKIQFVVSDIRCYNE